MVKDCPCLLCLNLKPGDYSLGFCRAHRIHIQKTVRNCTQYITANHLRLTPYQALIWYRNRAEYAAECVKQLEDYLGARLVEDIPTDAPGAVIHK